MGLANPATSQLAANFGAGPFEVWNAVGGDVDVDSADWRPFIEKKGLTKKASIRGWGETISQLKD